MLSFVSVSIFRYYALSRNAICPSLHNKWTSSHTCNISLMTENNKDDDDITMMIWEKAHKIFRTPSTSLVFCRNIQCKLKQWSQKHEVGLRKGLKNPVKISFFIKI